MLRTKAVRSATGEGGFTLQLSISRATPAHKARENASTAGVTAEFVEADMRQFVRPQALIQF